MKNFHILLLLSSFCVTKGSAQYSEQGNSFIYTASVMQQEIKIPPPGSGHTSPLIDLTCELHQEVGIASLIQNKTWQMTQMYADSIPLNDCIPKSFQFIFASDSLQTESSRILSLVRTVGKNTGSVEFKYTINQNASSISIYYGSTGVLQKTFKIVCLTPGHLAFTFPESGTTGSGTPKTIKMEYRFMVDYTWENHSRNNPFLNIRILKFHLKNTA